MPLNLSNRDQNSGHLFYNRRLRSAITRFSVRMKHDDRKQQAALLLAMVFVLIGCGWMALLQIVKPAGLVGDAAIVGNRDTGAIYARIDGRLHPAPNLTSARLAVGSAGAPTWVRAAEIAKYPTGPMIGIPGIPDDLTVTANPVSAWTVCDTAPRRGAGGRPTVTAIAGPLGSERSRPLPSDQAILSTHRGRTYLIWNGRRSRIDTTDRAVTFTLGLDTRTTRPVELSDALFDAIPATEPLGVPVIPAAGTPSRLVPGSVVGRILATRDAAGAVSGFYLLLADGVQPITPFVADLLRTADSRGASAPQLLAPDVLVDLPQVEVVNVGFYPTGKLTFVDTGANPVTCLAWAKNSTDPQAVTMLYSGRGLPTPQSLDPHLVSLVRDSRDTQSVEANQTLTVPGAATFVASTSALPESGSRESLFWISPQGVRFGIAWEDSTLQALALDPARAVQAPWPIVRTFAAGPAISRADALLARDAIGAQDSAAEPLRAQRDLGGR